MQDIFEKIIDNLYAYSDADEAEQYGTIPVIELDRAIEIVKQAAADYNKDQINQLAIMYAKNLVQFGVDITKIWDTATQQTSALNQAYIRGRQDERDRLEQYNNGWIPCSERLPELLEDITKDEDTFLKSCYLVTDGVFVCQAIFDEHGEFIDTLDFEPLIVTAWQPLPEPYQPNGECKKTKTNFDICCESVENMAHVIDIAKCGWTREEIIKWLQSEVE